MKNFILRLAQVLGGIISLIFGSIFLFVGIAEIVSDNPVDTLPEAFYFELLPTLILIFGAIGSYILTNIKRKYKICSILLISFGFAIFCSAILTKMLFYSDWSGRIAGGIMAGTMFGVPFIIVGILYLIGVKKEEIMIKQS